MLFFWALSAAQCRHEITHLDGVFDPGRRLDAAGGVDRGRSDPGHCGGDVTRMESTGQHDGAAAGDLSGERPIDHPAGPTEHAGRMSIEQKAGSRIAGRRIGRDLVGQGACFDVELPAVLCTEGWSFITVELNGVKQTAATKALQKVLVRVDHHGYATDLFRQAPDPPGQFSQRNVSF